jgi:hypothetical protein
MEEPSSTTDIRGFLTFIAPTDCREYQRLAEKLNAKYAADPAAAGELVAALRKLADHRAAREAAFDRFMRAALPGWRPCKPHTPAAL